MRKPAPQPPLRALALALLAGAMAAIGAAPLAAHDMWIEPSSFRPAPNHRVGVRLRVGERFAGDPVPRDPARIERFALVGPGGEVPVAGVPGGEPAGYATVGGPGLYWIVYDSNHASVSLPGDKFEEYLRLEGLEPILELRKKRGESQAPGREIYSRSIKSLLAVGDPGAGAGHDRVSGAPGAGMGSTVLGLDLELVPEQSPYRLKPGERLPVRLLYRGKPLQGALVVAVPRSKPAAALSARSDAQGRVAFALSRGDVWLVKAVHMVPAPAERKDADWESLWASLTFETP